VPFFAAIQKLDTLLAPDENTELKFGPLLQKYLKKLYKTTFEKGAVVEVSTASFEKNSRSVSCAVFKKLATANNRNEKSRFLVPFIT
jgi:hypothetical protein